MAHLTVFEGPNLGRTFQVSGGEILGSGRACTIVLADRRVALRHAEIRKRKTGNYEIRNLEPRKNILVNDAVIKSVTLQHGDWITISETVLVFSEDSEDEQEQVELNSIDSDSFLKSEIAGRRKQFADAESVIESIANSGGADNRLRVLYRVTHELTQILDLGQLVERLVTICLELFKNAEYCFVMLMDDGRKCLKPMASKVRGAPTGRLQYSRSVIKEVFRTKEAILCRDAQDDIRFNLNQSVADQELESLMCVPLLHQTEVIGILQVNSIPDDEPFVTEDLDLLSAIAMQVGILAENCKAYRQRQKYNQTLFHLGRATQQLSSLLQRERIFKEAVRIACKIMGCTKASVLLASSKDQLRLASVQGMSPEVLQNIDKRILGQRFVRSVISEGQPCLIADLRELGMNNQPRYKTSSLLIMPIISLALDREKPIGAICVTDKVSGEAFSGSDQKVLSILAGQIAITLKNADLYEKATIDAKTKVYRLEFFQMRLEEEMTIARKSQRPLSLLMLDIDYFKQVNDSYDHLVGDVVLKGFAALLKRTVRPTDVVARFGGEEFSIILTKADKERAIRVAERIRKAVEGRDFKTQEHVLQITCSLGVSTYRPGETPDSFLGRADKALMLAKRTGRNRYCLGE